MKGAEIITEYLIRERVPYAVGLCGHGDLGLLDALYDRSGEIRTLSVHHESAAGFIADAYYRIRHEPLATFTSVGPGSANLPVALGSAFMDASAFLAITGNVPTTQFSRAPFQETGRYYQADAPGVLRPYVKRSFQATRADQLPLKRPLIVAGYGVQNAEAAGELETFAAAAQIPVVTSPLGKSVGHSLSPLYLGATGRNGTYQANRAARSADVIIALGTRFDDRSTSSWLPGYTYSIPPARLIQVDADPAELGKNYPVALGVAANPKDVLGQLRDGLPAALDTCAWLADIATWAQEWERHIAPNRSSDASPLRPERVLADLRRVLPADGILISDVGVHHNWIVQEWQPVRPGTLLQSWGFASMCFGMAGVLGARLAAPDTPAVAVVGDGGFLMLPSVVASAVEYGLPAVWLVWNNGGYISIRDQQRGFFGAGREIATSFRYAATGGPYSADYAAMARSMGAQGLRVETAGDLGSALKTALDSGLPTVIDVPVQADAAQPSAATWQLPPLHHPEPTFGWPDPDGPIGPAASYRLPTSTP